MADIAPPIFKKRTNKSTANIRKRPATPPPTAAKNADSDDSASDYTDDDEAGVRVKRRKKQGVDISDKHAKQAQDFSRSTVYAADRSTHIAVSEDATKEASWYTDAALAAKLDGPGPGRTTNAIAKSVESSADAPSGTYRGTAKYSTFIDKNPDAPSRHVGPVKAPTSIRTITVTDFAPDVCKDYKQTGFCGFGDSCKFLHAREDYKQGWQLDKEWENVGKRDQKTGGAPGANKKTGRAGEDEDMDPEEKMLQQIPFACVICKEGYKNPHVTKCGHYFCFKCAMSRLQKEKKKTCAACGVDIGGQLQPAKKLKELLEKKRRRVQERKEKAREAGEDVSSDDSDDDD